jgi:hypothetical protein
VGVKCSCVQSRVQNTAPVSCNRVRESSDMSSSEIMRIAYRLPYLIGSKPQLLESANPAQLYRMI